MALKDWKKVGNAKHPTRKIRGIWFTKDKMGGVSVESADYSDDWVVYYGDPENANSKQFKTKSQALSFAKQYMRTH